MDTAQPEDKAIATIALAMVTAMEEMRKSRVAFERAAECMTRAAEAMLTVTERSWTAQHDHHRHSASVKAAVSDPAAAGPQFKLPANPKNLGFWEPGLKGVNDE